ncbi:unnamed protein product [Bursaphelenchus xylophilus]|uniref:(pine wood nematode) hypothetical protein n=1 Tax=Bursaphelenchus xylophilus TaxID=6326 RepID=A0A1I7RNP2_BURXY|nr:unnamed protein product [Bursaphelenchus xylophilus]CAG9124196.1 unnamed protein product [Bursaphelenchus xylophilus]
MNLWIGLILFPLVFGVPSATDGTIKLTTNIKFDDQFNKKSDDLKAACFETLRVERRVNESLQLDWDKELCPDPIKIDIVIADAEDREELAQAEDINGGQLLGKIGNQTYSYVRAEEKLECKNNEVQREETMYIMESKLVLGDKKCGEERNDKFSVIQLVTVISSSMVVVCFIVWLMVRYVEREKQVFVKNIESKYRQKGSIREPKTAIEKSRKGGATDSVSAVASTQKGSAE